MSGEVTSRNVQDLAWFKSSYSAGDGGDCIEVMAVPGAVYIRDSKNKTGPALSLTPAAWSAFVGFAADQPQH